MVERRPTATTGGATSPSCLGAAAGKGRRLPLEEELVHHLFSCCPSLRFFSFVTTRSVLLASMFAAPSHGFWSPHWAGGVLSNEFCLIITSPFFGKVKQGDGCLRDLICSEGQPSFID